MFRTYLILTLFCVKSAFSSVNIELDTSEEQQRFAATTAMNVSLSYLGRQLGAKDEFASDYGLWAIYMLVQHEKNLSNLKTGLLIAKGPAGDASFPQSTYETAFSPDFDKLCDVFFSKDFFSFPSDTSYLHLKNFLAPALSKGSSFYVRSDSYGFADLFKKFIETEHYYPLYKKFARLDSDSPYEDYFDKDKLSESLHCAKLYKNAQLGLQHLADSKSLLEEKLAHTEKAELHFFWSIGKKTPNGHNPNLLPKVLIGGNAYYGENFF